MNKETFEQMVLRIADDQRIIWREGCSYESGILTEEAISFATAICNELAKSTEPALVQHKKPMTDTSGELIGYGPWEEGIGLGWWPSRKLYACPPSAAARIAELEKQRDDLLAALKSVVETIEWMHGCTSPADDEIEKAINEGNTVIANVKGK